MKLESVLLKHRFRRYGACNIVISTMFLIARINYYRRIITAALLI